MPFHYSTLNYELAKSTPSGSINIMWNQLGEKMKADAMMFMTPNFDPSIGFTYPEFGMFGNNLLNPMLAIQQTMQSFQNGSWMNGLNGMNNGGNWFNNLPWNNWNNPWGNNNGNNTSANPEYDALKAVLNKYKEINPNDTTSVKVITDALDKSGTAEEKMEALKEAYKKLNKVKLQKALLNLPEYKDMLKAAGYNLTGMNKEADKELISSLNKLENSIEAKRTEWGGTINPASDNILRTISYWNDSHKTDENRSIIRLIANNLPTEESEREKQKNYAQALANALTDKAAEFKADFEGSFPKLDKAVEELNNASAAIKDNKTCTKANLMKLAEKFDTLYAMLRMMEAEKVRNEIKVKYNFLNNISSTDVDFVNDDLVVNATKEDLKTEGISVIPTTDDVPAEEIEEYHEAEDYSDCETAEEQVEKLVKKEHLAKTSKDGVYKTKTASTTGEATKYYTIKDDKLVELKNVTAIDANGECTMTNGSKKLMADVKAEEVTAEAVDQYNQTIKRIESLKDNKLVKCSNVTGLPAGTVIYRSKGNDEDGNRQYFVIKDNKLMKINGTVLASGTVKVNGVNKAFTELTDADFAEINDSDIITEDLKAKKEQTETEAAQQQEQAEQTAEEEKLNKKYEKPEINEDDTQTGKDIAKWLHGSTNDDEWDEAIEAISGIDAENVRSIISGYAPEEGLGTDNILEQIATEYQSTGFLGIGATKRDTDERLEAINHIIKAVLDHCDKYGIKSKNAYTQLKKAYDEGITEDMINNKAESTIRQLDKYILRLLAIKD